MPLTESVKGFCESMTCMEQLEGLVPLHEISDEEQDDFEGMVIVIENRDIITANLTRLS